MQIVFHTGAHFTNDDRLMRCLLRNKDRFANHGIAVPGPSKYRQLLRSTLHALKTASPDPNARDIILDAILDNEEADRLLLSNAHFFGVAKAAVQKGVFYPEAATGIANLRRLFPEDELEVFMAIRNPATFLPMVQSRSPDLDMTQILDGKDPRSLKWSAMITGMRQAAPDIPIFVWCDEDTPLIWTQILRDIAGLGPEEDISGAFEVLKTIMEPEGLAGLRAYLDKHRGITEIQTRRVITAFLDKFALQDAIEEELDVPGWTTDLVEDMTDLYDQDVLTVTQIPGVHFISA